MIANALDSLIAAFSPAAGCDRLRARHNFQVLNRTLPGYDSGRSNRRRKSVHSSTRREDVATGATYSQMIANAMNLYRNDPYTRSIIDVVNTYLGESKAQAATSDAGWNAAADEHFNQEWWTFADARRRPGWDYGTIQSVTDRAMWYMGDMFYPLVDGALLPVEGLQVATPMGLHQDRHIVNGIRLAAKAPNRITHFYVVNNDPKAEKKFQRFRQQEVIWTPSEAWRSAMLRGVPDLHAVIDALHDFADTQDNVRGKIKFESMIFSQERTGALNSMPGPKVVDIDATKGTQVEYTAAEWGARFKIDGTPGEDFILSEMKNPNDVYTDFMEFDARLIAAGTGIPYEIAMHIYTSGSYTANRAARVDFAKYILKRWAWRNKVLNQRVWNWVIARAMKSGRLDPAPIGPSGLSEWHKVKWTLPHFPSIDPGKEIVSDAKEWGAAQASLDDWAQKRGTTRTQLLDAHDADLDEMIPRAKARGLTLPEYMGQLFRASAKPEPDKVKP